MELFVRWLFIGGLNPANSMRRSGWAVSVLAVACNVAAIEPAVILRGQTTFDVQQAQTLATQQQPLQQLWQQRLSVAKAQMLQSGLRANPELMLEQTGFGSNQEREVSVGMSQKLDLFGERKTRQALASIQLNQQHILQARDDAELKLMVSLAYWQLAQSEWNSALVAQQQDLSQQALLVAKKRLDAGRIAQVDYERVQLTHQGQLQKTQAAQAQHQLARGQLAQLIGGDSFVPLQLNQPMQLPAQAHLASAEPDQQSPLQPLLQQQIQQQQRYADTALQLAKIQAKPQPRVSIAYVQNREPNNPEGNRSPRVALGVSVPLALFNKNQGAVQAQYAMQQGNDVASQWQLQQLQQRTQQQLLSLSASTQQYQQLTTQQLPIAQQIWRKTLLGFEAGKFTVSDVQQATRDYQQLQAEQLALLQQAWQLHHEIQALNLGISLSDVNSMLHALNQRLSAPLATSIAQGE